MPVSPKQASKAVLAKPPYSIGIMGIMGTKGVSPENPLKLPLNETPKSRSRAVVTEHNPPLRNTVPLNGTPKSRSRRKTMGSMGPMGPMGRRLRKATICPLNDTPKSRSGGFIVAPSVSDGMSRNHPLRESVLHRSILFNDCLTTRDGYEN